MGRDISENVNLAERLAELPPSILILTGAKLRAAAVVSGGDIIDAVWIDDEDQARGEAAGMAILGATKGTLAGYALDDPRVAEALTMLWRLPLAVDDIEMSWLDPASMLAAFRADGLDRVLVIDAPVRGIALFSRGELVAVYSETQRSAVASPERLRSLLSQARGRLTVMERKPRPVAAGAAPTIPSAVDFFSVVADPEPAIADEAAAAEDEAKPAVAEPEAHDVAVGAPATAWSHPFLREHPLIPVDQDAELAAAAQPEVEDVAASHEAAASEPGADSVSEAAAGMEPAADAEETSVAARGVDPDLALQLFELIALFAGYGFNGAHSISYGLIAYQTAYLKANFPREYMCALLNSRADNFDKLKQSILNSHARGLVVRPPDVNRSASAFSLGAEEQGEILYGLRHIKNVGERVADEIVAERAASGPFASLFDLCLRVSSRDLNRRVVEALIRSGACDSLGERGAMLAVLDRAIDRANAIRRERKSGQTSLFGDTVVLMEPVAPVIDDLDSRDANGPFAIAADERLSWEREFLGMYLSDHPLRRIAGELQQRVDTTINELGAHLDGLIVQVGGAIRDMRTFIPRRSTTGQRMAALQIEDLTGSVEVVVFARVFEECAAALRPDAVIVVRGKVEAGRSANGTVIAPLTEDEDRVDIEPPQILAEAVYAYDDPRLAAWRRDSTVHVSVSASQMATLGALRRALEEHRGDCPVVLHVDSGTSVDEISLAIDFSVDPGPALERAVEGLVGEDSYRVEMHRVRAPERERAGSRR